MKTIEELETYAKEHYVPIARKDLVTFICDLIKKSSYKNTKFKNRYLELLLFLSYCGIILVRKEKKIYDGFKYKKRITFINIKCFKRIFR